MVTKEKLKEEIRQLKKSLEVESRSHWSINYENGEPETIKVTGKDNNTNEYCIGNMVRFRLVDMFEKIIAQAELIYLSGKKPSYKHAFNHLKNRIEYEKEINK